MKQISPTAAILTVGRAAGVGGDAGFFAAFVVDRFGVAVVAPGAIRLLSSGVFAVLELLTLGRINSA